VVDEIASAAFFYTLREYRQGCSLCRPRRNAQKQILGYQHSFVMISVVGTGLSSRALSIPQLSSTLASPRFFTSVALWCNG
jgi:hypothetical protein